MNSDRQFKVFCSHQGLDIFHPITHQHQIWQPDPYDVETIHADARTAFEQLIARVNGRASSHSGRILLLLGESGAGKTHLMRNFRNQIHEQGKGFFSYMQMTSAVSDYSLYVLRNTIDSFDKPFYDPYGSTTGLSKLSNALAEDAEVITPQELERLRNDEIPPQELVDLIYPIADRVVSLSRFSGVDIDLIRALLFLQPGQSAINAKVYKLLRCEPLTPYDSKILGGLTSRDRGDDPLRMLASFAGLIQAVTDGAFVVCLDQLEDIDSMDEAGQRFQRTIQTIVSIAEFPNAIVVLSCLKDYYTILKKHLPKSHIDRLEFAPPPVSLEFQRQADDVKLIVERRLQALYELTDTPTGGASSSSLYPFPESTPNFLAGKTTRDVLEWCGRKRNESIATGLPPVIDDIVLPPPPPPPSFELSQLWNDHLTGTTQLPENTHDLLDLVANSIERCGTEISPPIEFKTSIDGHYLTADLCNNSSDSQSSLMVAMCQRPAQGGWLAKQLRELEQEANSHIPVALRTTKFPSNPKTQIAKLLGEFICSGGRRAQVADSDWRTMVAIQSFERQYGNRPDFSSWLQVEKPLSKLPSLQTILDLKNLPATAHSVPGTNNHVPTPSHQVESAPDPEPSKSTKLADLEDDSEPTLPSPQSHLPLGHTRKTVPETFELPREELVRHAAFLGGSGSGKTTLALTLIEQLLLRGVPAILLDRKGDLCSYANPEAWNAPCNTPRMEGYRQLLRNRIDINVYTPGTIGDRGRPLSIAITPPGLGSLPSVERQQISNYCAMALGGILNYKQYGQDKNRLAILGQAIKVLSTLQTETPLAIDRLIQFIADQDPLLVNEIGVLDPKHCKKLAEDLQTLSLMSGHLFSTQHEQLSIESLLRATSNRPKLSIINLGALGDNANIQFWVARFLLDLNRYARQHPSGQLQAVVLFDEADLYLPAQAKPSTKEPMENLLKRARSAGLGVMLSTQSPGDLDYKCRDQISSWFVGKVKESTAIKKLKPMLSEAKIDVSSKLANQKVGEFYAIRAGEVTAIQANLSLIRANQVSAETIQDLASQSHKP